MSASHAGQQGARTRRHPVRWVVLVLVLLVVACVAWIGIRALLAKSHLEKSVALATAIQQEITSGDPSAAKATAASLATQVHEARDLTGDPIWRGAEILPLVGPDLTAVRRVSEVLSNVTDDAIVPVAGVAGSVSLSDFKPVNGAVDLKPLVAAQPTISAAAADLRAQVKAAKDIDTSKTVSVVNSSVAQLVTTLSKASVAADTADDAVKLLPNMLGADGPRNYLLLFQNNAEVRAGGGIPGAVALIHSENGRITLAKQASTSDFPQQAEPALKLPLETEGIYGSITGEFLQDVTLTPQFDLSARIAQQMWADKYGVKVDGVLAIDPVTLSAILDATGPVALPSGESLTSANVVPTLLSETYARYPNPSDQDAFFASAASSIFSKVATGAFDPKALVTALGTAAGERRVLLWSADRTEQKIIEGTTLAGGLPVSTPSKPTFGVYLNDSTGAKMDYYLSEKIGIGSKGCREDGRPTWVVDVTLTNNAPQDAATSLPTYVTGGGQYGVTPGDIQTTVSIYAPRTGVFVGVSHDGKTSSLHTATDSGYPVSQFETAVSPGISTTWRLQFVGTGSPKTAPRLETTPLVHPIETNESLISCESPLS